MRQRLPAHYYSDGILAGDRLLLSQTITLVESQRTDDQRIAQQVLETILPHSGRSIRIGITGVPGVGKSTFIEVFGTYLTKLGHRLAVLTVDPTSQRSKGSLLGDKTRMEALSMNQAAYIRPSPAGDSLGGVAQHTRETILLCEAAGFDIILVETVGVGQSETVVHSMVDFFLLLLLAGAGDELQGIKRGIIELADALVITKADGANQVLANQARLNYQNALHLFPPTGTGWFPPVLTCSTLPLPGNLGSETEPPGIGTIWQTIQAHHQLTIQNGHRDRQRQDQYLHWFRALLRQQLDSRFFSQLGIRTQLAHLDKQITAGILLPTQAIDQLFKTVKA